jgi:hypothetical protein
MALTQKSIYKWSELLKLHPKAIKIVKPRWLMILHIGGGIASDIPAVKKA